MSAGCMPSQARSHALATALGITGQMVAWRDPDTGSLVLEGAVEALTGRSSGAFPGLDQLLAVVHPEDRAVLARRCAPSATRPGVHVVRFRFVRPDGHTVACEASVTRHTDPESGEDAGHVLIVRALPRTGPDDGPQRLAGLIEYLPDYISIHSTDGHCLAMNAAGRRLLGIARDEDVRRLGFVDIVADSISAPAHLLLPVVLSHGSHSTDVAMIHRRRAARVPAAWSASVVAGEHTGERYVVCIARDVSEQLEIEWELRQNQRRLTHALDVSRLGEWTMDIHARSSSPSRRLLEIFGHESESSERWSYAVFLEHIHSDDRERVERAFTRAVETGHDLDFEARIVRGDGELRWVSARGGVNRGLGGDGEHIGGVIQDITARKYTEQRDRFLADVSVPLNSLLDARRTLDEVVRFAVPFLANHCSVDLVLPNGALDRVAATHSLLATGAVGNPDANAPAALPTLLSRLLEQRQSVILDVDAPGQLDTIARTRSERLSLRALGVGSYLGLPLVLRGRCLGVLHCFRSDSGTRYTAKDRQVGQELATRTAGALENARLYHALRDSDHRKDEFLAMLSHELRNPLESLSVGVSLLETSTDEPQLDWARAMMRSQVGRLSDILEDLLDVSRYTFNKVVLEREPCELGPLLEQAVSEIRDRAEGLGYRVVLDPGSASLHVDVDVTRFGQVISNLLTNAIKYGGERGEIRVSARTDDEDRVVVTVSDEGVGLEVQELAGVFELFAQVDTTIDRSLGGLGMGLTLVRRIIEMHDGSVRAESDGPGRGTRFVVCLPRVDDVPGSTASPASAGSAESSVTTAFEPHDESEPTNAAAIVSAGVASASASSETLDDEAADAGVRRLMLVDDNVETVSALQKLFSLKGYEVRTAHDGLDALSLAEQFSPHAAVLDIGLPGASGYEVASRLRERYMSRPLLLVALSGYGQQQDRDRAREAGFDHHLLKPANFRVIAALLEDA